MVEHVRGIIHYDRGEYALARQLLQQSADAYAALGEIEYYMRARHFLANILYREQDLPAAKTIYEELLAWGETQNDLTWIARAHRPLGHCARQAGDFSRAVQHFHLSVQAFRELGQAAEVTRTEWGSALVLLSSGKPAEALPLFTAVRAGFHARGMVTEEALVALDMIDSHHALADMREVQRVAGEIIGTFLQAGMLTSALTAFAYLKESARDGTLTTPKIEHVRSFIRRLEREPTLLFLPPDAKFR
jgi:tetratricopeptide (TPR) repeat protein